MKPMLEPGSELIKSADALSEALHNNLMDWQVKPVSRTDNIETIVKPRTIGDIRLIELSGAPFCGTRERAEIGTDGEEFLGVLFQRTGSTHCRVGNSHTLVGPGEIGLWYSERPLEFEMPDEFRKLCMLIPVSRFESVLSEPTSYEGLHLAEGNPLTRLLASYLTTLSEEVALGHDDHACATVDVTLELLAAAFRANEAKDHKSPQKKLQNRVFQYIEARLGDADMTPASIAAGNGISLRYLYLLFNDHETTVAGWIRQRRLARCRSELANTRSTRTISEIAYKWGFSDAAHFSRLFKSAYGIAPTQFRSTMRAE